MTSIAFSLLNEAATNDLLVMDIDSIHSVLSLLSLSGRDQDAWSVLTWTANYSFGEHIRPDSTVYSRVLECACRTHNSGLLLQTFRLIGNDSSANIDESVFLDTLKYCSLTGYHRVALQVLACYSKFYRSIPVQAYSLFVAVIYTHYRSMQ